MNFYRYSMRNASVILFWGAFALFVVGFAIPLVQEFAVAPSFSAPQAVPLSTLLSAVQYGLYSASWPFVGAAVIWVLERGNEGRAQ